MSIGKAEYGIGAGFLLLNVGGQSFFATGDEKILVWIGGGFHVFASALLIFSIIMIAKTCMASTTTSMGRPQDQGIDWDMVIAFSLFAFTGFALTCVCVFLRGGSFWWNFFSIFLGVIAGCLSDRSLRANLSKKMPRAVGGGEDLDTWSSSAAPAGGANPATMRQRF